MRYAIALVSAVLFLGCTSSKNTQQAQESTPPNIIFLVGDGMGLSQVSSAYYFGEGEPNFSRFKNIGLSKTSSASHKITDSGAGANAFSTGKKTYNGSIACGYGYTLPLKNHHRRIIRPRLERGNDFHFLYYTRHTRCLLCTRKEPKNGRNHCPALDQQ
jgi:alkaline phosphatase